MPRKKPNKERSYHSIRISHTVYQKLKSIRNSLQNSSNSRVSFNFTINSLLNTQEMYDQLQNNHDHLQQKLNQLVTDENQYLKKLLEKALEKPQIVGMMPASNPTPSYGLIPPPASSTSPLYPPRSPPKISNYKSPDTGNLKNDYQKEIKQIFRGEILKPSEIAQTTKPNHLGHPINEIDEDFYVPPIETISTAKKFNETEPVLASG